MKNSMYRPCCQHHRLVMQHEAVGFSCRLLCLWICEGLIRNPNSCIRYCQQRCRVHFVLSLCAVVVEGASSHRKPRSTANSVIFSHGVYLTLLHGRLKSSKLPAGTGFPYDKMETPFQRLLVLWCKAYDTVTIYKGDDECNVCIYVGLCLLQRCWWRLHFLEYDAVQIDTYVPTFSECLLPPSLLFFGYPVDGVSKSLRTLVPVCQSTLCHFPIEWILFKVIYI
jgi:hypothetical protein